MFRATVLLFVAGALLGSPSLRAEDGYGELTGQFVFDGAIPKPTLLHAAGASTVKDAAVCAAADTYAEDLVVDKETKGIANVFVYLTSKDGKKIKLPESLKESKVKELDFYQKGCAFVPHCLSIRTDQTVLVKSMDAVAHNMHLYTVRNQPPGFLVPPNDHRKGFTMTFTDAESAPMPVKCDIHGWMTAHWLILDHPYHAVTDKQGTFRIDGLPPGEYSFRVWHERPGYINRDWKVTIAGTKTTMPPVKVPAKKLERPQ